MIDFISCIGVSLIGMIVNMIDTIVNMHMVSVIACDECWGCLSAYAAKECLCAGARISNPLNARSLGYDGLSRSDRNGIYRKKSR